MANKYDDLITQDVIKNILEYNQYSGKFIWKNCAGRRKRNGDTAGFKDSQGYVKIKIFGKSHFAHRVAFIYMTGRSPVEEIDHVNLVKDDNKWSNLREATRLQNSMNKWKRKHNRSGFKGVSFHKRCKKWVAQIQKNKKCYHLGYYKTPQEAYSIYIREALRQHGKFAQIN